MKSYDMQAHRDSNNKIIGYTVATYDKDTGEFLAISDLFRDWDSAMAYMRCCAAERNKERKRNEE